MYLSALVALFAPVVFGQATNCTEYCETIQQVCTGVNAQFGTDATAGMLCSAACQIYPKVGNVGDPSGDSFNCRAYHLSVAEASSDPLQVALHCQHAGFYGGGVCGNQHGGTVTPQSAATDFQCNLAAAVCNIADEAACYTAYTTYAPLVLDSFNMSNTKVFFKETGNTLQCRTRILFQGLLLPPSAATACTNGAAVSPACTVDCNDFCLLEESACGFGSTENNQYANNAACLAACQSWTASPINMSQPIASGDSSGCRWYHLGVAATSQDNADVHCPHTSNWNGVCAANCNYYCQTIQAACVGPNAQFESNEACQTACENYTTLSFPYTRPVTKGNNLECRIYHAEVAYTNWADATAHCPHAGAMSTPETCGAGNAASSIKVGVATAILVMIGVASSLLGF